MRRRSFLVSGLAVSTMAQTLTAALQRQHLDEASSLIESAVTDGKVSAASLYIKQHNLIFPKGYGEAKSADTIFLIASITKPMTAAGVMKLVDRGEVGLDDPVKKFIPEFSEGDRKLITVKHLLTHTSGMPDQLPENVELRKRHAPLDEFVERAIRTPLLFKPGAQYKYQSMGILLASEIAQRVTKLKFPEYLDQEVFQPLGMSRTALGLGSFQIADTALCQVAQAPGLYGGGDDDTKSWDWNSPYWRNFGAPWGGAHSTGPDIARFLESFLNPDGKVVKPETAKMMIRDHNQGLNEPFGLGFVVKPGRFGKNCSPETFGHSGATGTIAWTDQQTKLTCVVLTTLPSDISDDLVLHPVCDKVSEAAA